MKKKDFPSRAWTVALLRWCLCLAALLLFVQCDGSPLADESIPQELIILQGDAAQEPAPQAPDDATHDQARPPTPDARPWPEPPRFYEKIWRDRSFSEPRNSPDQQITTGPEPRPEPGLEPPTTDTRSGPEPRPLPDPRTGTGTPCSVGGVAGICLPTKDCDGGRQSTPGHCPGPKDIQCCTKPSPPSSSCDPNARPQPNAGLTEAPGQGGCPAGMVKISTFCIDRYEAALVEVLPNGQTRPWSPYFNPGNTRVRAVSLQGAVPQGYISGLQAARACKEAGKRLCTDAEWLRACQGPQKYTYPYGPTRKPGLCNDARSIHPAVEYFKSSASWVFSKIQHQCLNQLPRSLAKTGSHTGCVTAEGVFDMMGNLHEWTANPTGVFRGGFYVDTYRNGPGCLYRTTAHNTQHWDYSTGFRCCK